MADAGPSSDRLPFIGPHTSNLLSPMFASTQHGTITALATTNVTAPSLAFDTILVTDPSSQGSGVLSARIDTRIKLRVSFHPGSPIQFLKIPKTPSVHGECPTPERSLRFSLELKGPGNGTILRNVCGKCKERKDQATWDMVDFRAPTTIITIENGTANIEFSIKCYAHHHGMMYFCAEAILRDYQNNVIDCAQLPLHLNISGKGKKQTKPKKAQKRAVRGVSAQQHSIYLSSHLDNLLSSGTNTNSVAPGIFPVVPPSVNHSGLDPQHVDNGTVEWMNSHLEIPIGDNRQTSSSDQQAAWVDPTTGLFSATDPLFWPTVSAPINALSFMTSNAHQPFELGVGPHNIDPLHCLNSLPLNGNSNPVVCSGTLASTSPHHEQILPVTSCEDAAVPRSHTTTSAEPHSGHSITQASRVPEATPQMLSQGSSGVSRPLNTSSAVPSGQGGSTPDISIPSETSRLQMESPAHTRNESLNQTTDETLLEEVDPEKGPTTGGIRIALFGENFPAIPLYVGFGDNWVRARRRDGRTLRCRLPPSIHPGIVNVTISQTPSRNACEVGWSTATFEYEDSRAEALLSILKIVYQLADETTRQKMGPAQWFTTMNNPSLNTGTTHSSNQGRKEIPPRLEDVNLEDISIQFLCTYSTHPNWKHIVSSRNDYGQTMAHICVTLGYFRLLQHLSTWQIDLNVVDHMGLTALHYAYLFIQEECARLLIHSGAERFILDDLGRSPSSLNPSLEVRVDPNMEIGGDSSPRSILLPPQRRQPWTFRSIFGPQFSFRSPRTSLIKMSALSEYIAGVVLASGVFLRDSLFGQSKSTPSVPPVNGADSRDFVSKMKATKKRLVIFYGSQTGTAEEYAIRLAKEAKSRFGIASLVCDPEDFEFENLDAIPNDCAVAFVVATYGEGEPTDNAVQLMQNLEDADFAFSNGERRLDGLNYVVFGLGNRTYEHYNLIARKVDDKLTELGASRLGPRGEGDDDKALEEDYLEWKEKMWPELAAALNVEEGQGGDTPDFVVTEDTPYPQEKVYLGELSAHALTKTRGIHDARNPYPAPITVARELFAHGHERNCVHIELNIEGSGINYQHGDHVGVWPTNPEVEVDRLLAALGLWDKRDTVINIVSLDPALAKVPFPVPTTYGTVLRHYIDISAVASRQLLGIVSKFAPNEAAQKSLQALATDKEKYHEVVADGCLRFGQVLQLVCGNSIIATPTPKNTTAWDIPFETIVSCIPRLQPRYYSISSSPKYAPGSIHITAVVLKYQSKEVEGAPIRWVHGVGSNLLHNFRFAVDGHAAPLVSQDPALPELAAVPHYHIIGPRGAYLEETTYKVPINVRRSTFRLPTNPRCPVVMIGPGTGIAPFRGFVQERVSLAKRAIEKSGEDALAEWGAMYLFYGCRSSKEDFLYKEEWPEYQAVLGDKFKMFVAVSREGPRKPDGSKVYVQDLLARESKGIADALINGKGYVYVCGDAKNMSKAVEAQLVHILGAGAGGNAEAVGLKELNTLKEKSRYLTDVWS